MADYGELLVARLVGRNLSRTEGCLVQLATLVVVFVGIYLFVASGAFMTIVQAVAGWYAHQIKLPGAPTPIPSP